jgi:hypothetical protein
VREATNLESGRTTPVRQSEGTVSLEQTIPGEQILVLRLER